MTTSNVIGIKVLAPPSGVFCLPACNTLMNNLISDNSLGVESTKDSGGINVVGNTIMRNDTGIAVYGHDNTLAENRVWLNKGNGIVILGTAAVANLVQANLVGTNDSGSTALGNGWGVAIRDGAAHNVIGGHRDLTGGKLGGEGNLISGNKNAGVCITADATTNMVQGNFIGTNISGTTPVPNGTAPSGVPSSKDGVWITAGANDNTIGASDDANLANVISANRGSGVYIDGFGTDRNRVAGNYIGTDVRGAGPLGNATNGVFITNHASNNFIGTGARGPRQPDNVISGNQQDGILITGPAVTANVVRGNYIGTDNTGNRPLPNTRHGVEINNVPGNFIGTEGQPAGQPDNVISGNQQDGILITGPAATANVVRGNYIGTDAAGNLPLGNTNGVEINNASNNFIGTGGPAPGQADNVISGNKLDGILLWQGASGNKVQGNYIGTDYQGKKALANSWNGVEINNASNNFIGTGRPAPGQADNVISGNERDGILLWQGASENKVQGNYIGTDYQGKKALANSWQGVEINNASKNFIGTGGPAPGQADNVISGNKLDGILLWQGASGNKVQGNYIGTDNTGNGPLPNTGHGVEINNAPGNFIGTGGQPAGQPDNVISGNKQNGIFITGPAATANVVQGNYIGTDITGANELGNFGSGVEIFDGAASNTIGGAFRITPGGPCTGACNLISGNDDDGVFFGNAGDRNVVDSNYIGTDITGDPPIGNGAHGVEINQTSNVIVKGSVISGNSYDGVLIIGLNSLSNRVEGNMIGTDVAGSIAVPNLAHGVEILLGSGNCIGKCDIGGVVFGSMNIISGNRGSGVRIAGVGARVNMVQNNYIGTDTTGSKTLPNEGVGVDVDGGASQNFIGGVLDEGGKLKDGNVISGNRNIGVRLAGPVTQHNQVQGNYIGTDKTCTKAVPNTGSGVQIALGAFNNLIGGDPSSLLGNVISGNGGNGVFINDPGTKDNTVQGNWIGTDKTGTKAIANELNGVEIFNKAFSNLIGDNVISGNTKDGVYIDNKTNKNKVQGNYIGTDQTGARQLPNGGHGVELALGANANWIGGKSAEQGNVISGNMKDGVLISGKGTTDNVVQNNYIGTDKAGGKALGNGGNGVEINDAAGNKVGLTRGGRPQNLISGNNGDGILLTGNGTTDNQVLSNYIGTDLRGEVAVANKSHGVQIRDGASRNAIGGSAALGNVISGNGLDGIRIMGTGTDENRVQGNRIGTDATGLLALGNGGQGVAVMGGAARNLIGMDESHATIDHGGGFVDHGDLKANGSTIFIGPVARLTDGMQSAQSGSLFTNNSVGIRRFYTTFTFQIHDGTTPAGEGLTFTIQASGPSALGPGGGGLGYGPDHPGPDRGIRNSVAIKFDLFDNAGEGPNSTGLFSDGRSPTIPESNSGDVLVDLRSTAIDLGSQHPFRVDMAYNGTTLLVTITDTVTMMSAHQTYTVDIAAKIGSDIAFAGFTGGTSTYTAAQDILMWRFYDQGNLISANQGNGVAIWGAGTDGNVVRGNCIGTDATGSLALGNRGNGVSITSGASNNTIGGTTAQGNVVSSTGAGNTIAFNGGAGVVIGVDANDYTTTGNGVLGNAIYANGALGIDLGNDGVTPKHPTNPDVGPNNWQNYPERLVVVTAGSTTRITGTLHSTPSTSFQIEFFSNDVADPTGFGQGQTFIGFTTVTTDTNGNASFTFTVTVSLTMTQCVATTATDPDNNTSEFSACAPVTEPDAPRGRAAAAGSTFASRATLVNAVLSTFSSAPEATRSLASAEDPRSASTSSNLPKDAASSRLATLDRFFSSLAKDQRAESQASGQRRSNSATQQLLADSAWAVDFDHLTF